MSAKSPRIPEASQAPERGRSATPLERELVAAHLHVIDSMVANVDYLFTETQPLQPNQQSEGDSFYAQEAA